MLTPIHALAVVIALASAAVAAAKPQGWQFIGRFDSGDTQYIEMSSLKKERGYIRVRTLIDYKKPVWSVTSKEIRSEAGTDYIDCKGKRFAILDAASYECRMAKCSPKESARYPFDETEFKPISTESSQIGNVYSLVCQ